MEKEQKVAMTSRKSNGSDPFAVALRLLTGRDRSCNDLKKRLKDRGFSDDAIDETIRRCLDYGYLDDRRFATNKARALISSGRAVGSRAILEMKKHGLDSDLIDQSLTAANAEVDLGELLRELFLRRYPDYVNRQIDKRMQQRIIGYFQRRGFPLSLIFDTMKLTDDS
jgi:regulatory protein